MLCLSRRKGEGIVVNRNVTVRVLSIRGDVVQLGIEADPDIRVDREEVHKKRLEKERQAAKSEAETSAQEQPT